MGLRGRESKARQLLADVAQVMGEFAWDIAIEHRWEHVIGYVEGHVVVYSCYHVVESVWSRVDSGAELA